MCVWKNKNLSALRAKHLGGAGRATEVCGKAAGRKTGSRGTGPLTAAPARARRDLSDWHRVPPEGLDAEPRGFSAEPGDPDAQNGTRILTSHTTAPDHPRMLAPIRNCLPRPASKG